MSFSEFYKEHRTAFLLALLVGIIYVFPHLVYLYYSEHYNPLYVAQGRAFLDEALYAAGVQEVLEGNLVPSDLAVYEHKNGPFFYGPVPFMIMAVLAKIAGGIRNAIIVSDFVFSALIFFIFYLLGRAILKSVSLSILSGLVLIFWYRLFIPPAVLSLSGWWHHIVNVIFGVPGQPVHFWFSRFVNPQIPTIIFLVGLLFLYQALEQEQLSFYLLAGIFFGLTFYSYLYFWTYLVVLLGLLFLWYCFKKSWKEVRGIAIVGSTGLLLAIPFFINLLSVGSGDLIARSGIELGRFFEPISLLYLLLFLGIFYIIKRTISSLFISFLLLAGVVVLNAQLILGYTIQNNHWNSRVLVLVLILTLFYLLGRVYNNIKLPSLKSSPRFSKFLSAGIMVLIFLLAITAHAREVYALHQSYSFSSQEYELLQSITVNLSPQDVVLTSSLTWNLWIPAYTSANIYFPYGAATVASDNELSQRFLTTFKLLGYSSLEVEQQLTAPSAYTRISSVQDLNSSSFQSFLRSYIFVDLIYPAEKQGWFKKHSYDSSYVTDLSASYSKFTLSAEDFTRFKIDYILLVGDEKAAQKSIFTFLQRIGKKPVVVFNNEQYVLIQV